LCRYSPAFQEQYFSRSPSLSKQYLLAVCFLTTLIVIATYAALVSSFFGVLLIARPQSLFGGLQDNLPDAVTSGERMQSVMSARHCLTSQDFFSYYYSAGLIGVLGATASCESLCYLSSTAIYLFFELRHPHPCDRKTGTSSSRSRFLLFGMCSHFFNRVCPAAQLASAPYDFLDIFHLSMIIFKIPPVIPTRISWLVLIFLVGIFGLVGQVCSSFLFLFL
jgi:hypothetical protein